MFEQRRKRFSVAVTVMLQGEPEETLPDVVHSLAYFQIVCFAPQQMRCSAYGVTSFSSRRVGPRGGRRTFANEFRDTHLSYCLYYIMIPRLQICC